MRSEFEGLPHIAELIKDGNVFYCRKGDWYICDDFSIELALDTSWIVYQHQQSKVDELQRRNRILNDNIKGQGQKLVYQNEVIETQAEKLLGLRDEKVGLQKRLDAALEVVKQGIRKQGIGKPCGDYYLEKVEEILEGGGY